MTFPPFNWEKVVKTLGFADCKSLRNNHDLKACLANKNAVVNQNETGCNQITQHMVGTWKLLYISFLTLETNN